MSDPRDPLRSPSDDGKPVVAGLHITDLILEKLGSGESIEAVLSPTLA